MELRDLPFDEMDTIYNKTLNGKYPDYYHYMDNLNTTDIEVMDNIIEVLEEDIEKHYINRKNRFSTTDKRLKLIMAWQSLMYIRDSRSISQLLNNVENNWNFEDSIVKQFKSLGKTVMLDGNDKDRKPSLFNFNSMPDIKVDNIKVEIQQGTNCFFKINKINTCIKYEAFILYYHTKLKKYHLFTPNEIKQLLSESETILYGFKKGRQFSTDNYSWYDFKEAIEELL